MKRIYWSEGLGHPAKLLGRVKSLEAALRIVTKLRCAGVLDAWFLEDHDGYEKS